MRPSLANDRSLENDHARPHDVPRKRHRCHTQTLRIRIRSISYRVLHEFEFEFDGQKKFGMGFATSDGDKTTTWFIQGPSQYGEPVKRGCHLAWKAPNRAAVNAV